MMLLLKIVLRLIISRLC